MMGFLMGGGPLPDGVRGSLQGALYLKSKKEPSCAVGQPVQRPWGTHLALHCTRWQVGVIGGRVVVAPSAFVSSLRATCTPVGLHVPLLKSFNSSKRQVLVLQLSTVSDAVTRPRSHSKHLGFLISQFTSSFDLF